MKQKLLCVLFLFLQFTYAQTPGMDVLEKERQIKRTLNTKPDSARIYIQQLLSYKGKLPDTVYANAYTAYGYTHNLKNNIDSSLFYYNKALTFLNSKKNPALYGRILRNKANSLKKRGDYQVALDLLNEAEQSYRIAGDSKGIAAVYGEIASNYNMLLRSDDALDYLFKSIAILEKTNDKTFILTVKLSLANTYMNIGNLNFASDLYKEILEGFKQNNVPKNYSITLINYGDCLSKMGKYAEAQKVLINALPTLERFGDQELIGITYSKLGQIKLSQNKKYEAENYLKVAFKKTLANNSPRTLTIAVEYLSVLNEMNKNKEGLELINIIENSGVIAKANLADKMVYEAEKSKTYLKANKKDIAVEAAKNSIKLKDTFNRTIDSGSVIAVQQTYQNHYQNKKRQKLASQNTWLQEELYENRLIKIIPLLCVSLLLLIVIIIYLFKNKKHKSQLTIAKAKKDILLKEYENTRMLNRLHKENIDNKKKELVSDIISIATLEGNISNLITHISKNPNDVGIEEINKRLQAIASDDDYWIVFRKHFNENYAGFQHNLEQKFPILTKNDLFFCSLLKLNLPYKDIALLMQVTPESIVKKKYRIKKRIGIESEQELETVLLSTSL